MSSPDRVVYEATDWAPAVTKLEVCEYFALVGEVLMHASATVRWRWNAGRVAGARACACPWTPLGHQTGDGFYSKRLPKGAPDWHPDLPGHLPQRPTASTSCASTEPAVAVWAAQMGTLTFHPWAVRSGDVDHPDELRLDLDPQPGASFADAQRVAGVARELLEELGLRGYPKTSGNRGIHVYVRIRPEWTFDDVRHAAIGFGRELERRDGGVTTAWWKEERGEARSSSTSTRTSGTGPSPAPGPCGRGPGAPVCTPMTWDQLAEVDDPRDFNLPHGPGLPRRW